MFSTLTINELEQVLDQFFVPMFVIERDAPDGDFCLVGMNSAFVALSGYDRSDLSGRSLSTLAPGKMPKEALSFFQRCVTTRQTVRFAHIYEHDQTDVRWDTTLQYATSSEQHDRIIATAITAPCEQPVLQDRLAFEDLQYFSSIADLQLENLSSAFTCATKVARITPIDEARVMSLHAVCRTVQRSVADIKDIVHRAQKRHAQNTEQQYVAPIQLDVPVPFEGMDTVNALAEAGANIANTGRR